MNILYSYSRIFHTLLIALLAIIFYAVVNFFSTNAFISLTIKGVFPDSGSAKVYYAKSTHGFSKEIVVGANIEGNGEQQTVSIGLSNKIVHKLKLNFSSESSAESTPLPIIIQKITLTGFFQAKPIIIDLSTVKHAGIYSPDNGIALQLKDTSELEVLSIKPKKHVFVHYVLPVFLALGFWLLLINANWREFPAIKDLLNNQQARNTDNLRSLDGLRGLAALTVLLEHTMGSFGGLGRAGVWLFFVLSGFLLIRSFVQYPEKMMTLKGLESYFVKRIKRVLPMFYFMVTIVFLLHGQMDVAIRHYLLIQGDGHFWTILHELYFYMFLPVIACSVYLLFKRRYLWTIALLIGLATAWYNFASPSWISIYGLGIRHAPYFYVFLIGMATGYFYYGTYLNSESIQRLSKAVNKPLSWLALVVLMVFFFYSSNLGVIDEGFTVSKFPFASAMLAAMLILMSAISSERSVYNRILSSSILRLLGIVGYSFYLIHPYAIAIFITSFEFIFVVPPHIVLPSIVTALGSFCITLPLAMFTYSYIERPFLKK